MSLLRFQDKTYLQRSDVWFLWESAWGMFRPITALQWDGTQFVVNDTAFCADPTDPLFGFGSDKMKEVCTILTDQYEPQLEKARNVASICIGPPSWVRDRQVSLTACAPQTTESWKRLCNGRSKTCKRVQVRQRFTRRIL